MGRDRLGDHVYARLFEYQLVNCKYSKPAVHSKTVVKATTAAQQETREGVYLKVCDLLIFVFIWV